MVASKGIQVRYSSEIVWGPGEYKSVDRLADERPLRSMTYLLFLFKV